MVRAVVDHQADTMVGGQETFDFSTLEGLRAWRDFVVRPSASATASAAAQSALSEAS